MTLFLTKNLCLDLETVFSQFALCLTSNNSTSQNIGGLMHRPSPTSNSGRTVPPVRHKSRRVEILVVSDIYCGRSSFLLGMNVNPDIRFLLV